MCFFVFDVIFGVGRQQMQGALCMLGWAGLGWAYGVWRVARGVK